MTNVMSKALIEKIRTRQACVSVIGLGYVGLPLAVEFAKAGLKTIAFDVDVDKVEKLRRGKSYIGDVPDGEIRQ